MRKQTSLLLMTTLLVWPMTTVARGQGAPPAPAVPTPLEKLKDRPDTPGSDDATLGEWFDSVAAGIKFRPPANMKRQGRPVASDYIVRYADEHRGWVFDATRTSFDRKIDLSNQGNPGAPAGLLEITRDELKANAPGAEIVREDVINVGDYTVAMLAARFTVGLTRVLSQQAIVRSDDRLYYTLSLTTPAARQRDDGTTPDNDPGEARAVEAFRASVDTVALLDRTPVLDDQRERLFRTRALFVNLTPDKMLKPISVMDIAETNPKTRQDGKGEQYLRILQDGKDVGYTYVLANEEKRGATDGIYVGVRTRTKLAPEPTKQAGTAAALKAPATAPSVVQTDSESIMWMSTDRKHETWRTIVVVDDAGGRDKDHSTEIGTSDRQTERVLERDEPVGEKLDPRNPPVRKEDVYSLSVTMQSTRANAEPVQRSLPPFYLPQAMGFLIPRLVPLNEPKTYMFASWVTEAREVMSRYVDVGREQNVTLGGKKQLAVPVKDRFGLEGSITTHWVTLDGTYLGSVNEDSQLTVLPTDEETLRKIWIDATLTAPKADTKTAQQPAAGIPTSDQRGNLQ
jgi:hypothetical protein